MQKSVLYNLDALPVPKDPVEQDYIDLITLLFNEKQHFITKKEEEWKETIDYYTLWAHQIKVPLAAMRISLRAEALALVISARVEALLMAFTPSSWASLMLL